MVTTIPNIVVAEVQDRMPVLLREEEYETWMNPDTSLSDLKALMIPYPPDLFVIEELESTKRTKPEREKPPKKPTVEPTGSLFDEE